MTRETVNALCATLPGATRSDPWGDGHDAWKVGDRLFAVIGARTPGVSVKTASPEDAALLIDMGQAVKAPYFHASWVLVPWDQATTEDLAHRIRTSYDLIVSKLPRKTRAALAPGIAP